MLGGLFRSPVFSLFPTGQGKSVRGNGKKEGSLLAGRHAKRDVRLVVVHKVVRRERIRPYRGSVPVSRETPWRGPGRFKASTRGARSVLLLRGELTCTCVCTTMHMDRAGSSRRGGERVIESAK